MVDISGDGDENQGTIFICDYSVRFDKNCQKGQLQPYGLQYCTILQECHVQLQ